MPLPPSLAPLNAAVFNESSFMRAFSVVVGRSCFLPSASCFALLPLASLMGRTGNSNGCDLDYSPEANGVVVRAGRPYRYGRGPARGVVRAAGGIGGRRSKESGVGEGGRRSRV